MGWGGVGVGGWHVKAMGKFLKRVPLYKKLTTLYSALLICGATVLVALAGQVAKITSQAKEIGVHLKAVFPPLNLGLIRISRSRFKQSKNSLLISQIYVLR